MRASVDIGPYPRRKFKDCSRMFANSSYLLVKK